MESAILFDLDGTLLDTVPDIALCLNGTLEGFGCPPVSLERTRRAVGNGARKLMERVLPAGIPMEEAFADFKRRYAASENLRTRAYDGAAETLRLLKAEGWKLAVLTNKPRAAAEKTLARFFAGMFDFLIADDGKFPLKPDPASTLYCMETLGVPKESCVFVGDGETDVQTAKNAGIPCISALWGYREREELQRAGAAVFAEKFCELPALAKKMLDIR